MPRPTYAALAVVALLLSTSVQVQAVPATNAKAVLSSHWVPGWGFRDELNSSDIDYQNFWTDNAGKILMASLMTNDTVDAGRASDFIQSHMTASYYMPEVLVNSSMIEPWSNPGNVSLSNRIALLWASNGSRTEAERLTQLALGDYYASPQLEGYLGADRIWYNGTPHTANSSVVFTIPHGLVKKARFSFSGLSFYTYLNVTMSIGEPYVKVSLQVQPMDSTFGAGDHLYLQAFAGANGTLKQYAFENVTVFYANGNLNGTTPFKGATPQRSGGLVIAYSNRTSVLDQDSVALRFNATGINDIEHWYQDVAFGGLSWVGLGYNVNETGLGELSAPVYAEVYPIQHLDYHLLSDTAKYVVSDPRDVSVAPPVSFGFISYGLALETASDPQNATLASLARGYWNSYFDRYDSSGPSNSYSRSINVLALAGFTLYGCNSTVEGFTRDFVARNPGASIEEYGWAAAALYQLDRCTDNPSDLASYRSVISAFSSDPDHFVRLNVPGAVIPAWTFQYGEAASGLMLGGVPFNSTSVLSSISAVYQSNVNGTVLNQPFHGDLANTETLPAYVLSTRLFEDEMNRTTGYWVSSLSNCNITSLSYVGGSLTITATGRNGILALSDAKGSIDYAISGSEVIQATTSPTTTTTTVTQSVTTTVTSIQTVTESGTTSTTTVSATSTTTSTTTTTVASTWSPQPWVYAAVVVLLIVGLAVGYIVGGYRSASRRITRARYNSNPRDCVCRGDEFLSGRLRYVTFRATVLELPTLFVSPG
jgi:hypothetical protein